jgi:hypothetical protein
MSGDLAGWRGVNGNSGIIGPQPSAKSETQKIEQNGFD